MPVKEVDISAIEKQDMLHMAESMDVDVTIVNEDIALVSGAQLPDYFPVPEE